MTKRMPPSVTYSGRSPDVVPINISVDREAARLIRLLSPTAKGMGRFVSRLVFEYVARLEERQRLCDRVLAAVGVVDEDKHACRVQQRLRAHFWRSRNSQASALDGARARPSVVIVAREYILLQAAFLCR